MIQGRHCISTYDRTSKNKHKEIIGNNQSNDQDQCR
jgi:hypothetical protein